MTTDEILEYYANLLPAEYRSQPNAYATIQTLAALGLFPQGGNVVTDPQTGDPLFNNGQLVIDSPYGELLPLALQKAFDIQTAVGQQLDYLAKPIGAKRSGYTLSGQWVTLGDSDFRLLLQAAGAKNFLRATTKAITTFVSQFFQGLLRVTDNLGMHMTFTYLSSLGSHIWIELFISQGFLPSPLGVSAGEVIIGTNFFGFRTSTTPPPSWVRPFCLSMAPVHSSTPLLLSTDRVAP